MKNKLKTIFIIALIILNIFISVYAINTNKKYQDIKDNYEYIKSYYPIIEDRLDTIVLKKGESTKIKLDSRQYTLKLLEISKQEPCPEVEPDPSWPCAWSGEYHVSFSINGIEFALDSELNPSHPIITTNFSTDYIVYYVPKYNDQEATFFIEKDTAYKKENNLIIGDYIVYTDDSGKVIDINTFTREVQIWGKEYEGKSINEIKELINNNIDLKTKEKQSE